MLLLCNNSVIYSLQSGDRSVMARQDPPTEDQWLELHDFATPDIKKWINHLDSCLQMDLGKE
jgi:hypothetical protein